MRVILVAETYLSLDEETGGQGIDGMGYRKHPLLWEELDDDGSRPPDAWVRSSDELAEAAGRLCYKSWNRPNLTTATNSGYLANIIRQKHFSVLEHASATFYISGVTRAMTHELIRHRHFSYSEVSQRYVDMKGQPSAGHPVLAGYADVQLGSSGDWTIADELEEIQVHTNDAYVHIQDALLPLTDRKTANGAARMVLPEMTETEILLTGNMRAYREFLDKRLSPSADAEIRQLAEALLAELKKIAPNTFQDMEVKV